MKSIVSLMVYVICFLYTHINVAVSSDDMDSCFPESRTYPVLTSIPSAKSLVPGIYETDDIGLILTYAVENLVEGDLVIFDIDDVLITHRLDPFYMTHTKNKTPLFERFDALEESVKNLYFFYLHTSHSPSVISLMDERLPSMVILLQSKGIKCIGNTALRAIRYGSVYTFDDAEARIKLLKDLGISFSSAFPECESWKFESLTGSCKPEEQPFFKDGIVFSGKTIPKHLTQHELFKMLGIIPKKLIFIDDLRRNVTRMQDYMTALGIECYSFLYFKKRSRDMLSYFPDSKYASELCLLERFVEKLLDNAFIGEDFEQIYYKEFLKANTEVISGNPKDEPTTCASASIDGLPKLSPVEVIPSLRLVRTPDNVTYAPIEIWDESMEEPGVRWIKVIVAEDGEITLLPDSLDKIAGYNWQWCTRTDK